MEELAAVYYFVVFTLYGAGMYICGYRKALKKATEDMKEMFLGEGKRCD